MPSGHEVNEKTRLYGGFFIIYRKWNIELRVSLIKNKRQR
ncbi:hypothetical protein PROVRUST_06160 [Providencia rustigianii DSM 4541]|uniref:Uncharacterized protein n=1 Tax=Providencia rustigianii DSM 4541 TaxID=500637 RepID=D1P1T7_9GAMM|nr:hypothetical protein PROVRUST_06160 [Providencia rustigianii DSM 4541]